MSSKGVFDAKIPFCVSSHVTGLVPRPCCLLFRNERHSPCFTPGQGAPSFPHPQKIQGAWGPREAARSPNSHCSFLLWGLFAQRMSRDGWASPAGLKGHEYSYNPLERRALSLEKQIPPGCLGTCCPPPALRAASSVPLCLSAPQPLGPSWLLLILTRPG